ncbi:MAG: hypothetical protein M1338_00075, partial [Patescibacteria group bacterium]|nr:hypothetical protein [Patescibacteria group bacterium]
LKTIVNRSNKALALDFDGTITNATAEMPSHWELITNTFCNKKGREERERIKARFLPLFHNGEMDLFSAEKLILQTLTVFAANKITLKKLWRLADKITPRQDLNRLTQIFSPNCFVVSYGIVNFIEIYLKYYELSINPIYGIRYRFNQSSRVINGIYPQRTHINKDFFIAKYAFEHGIPLCNIITITDSLYGDAKMRMNETLNVYLEKWPENTDYSTIPNLDMVIRGGSFTELVKLLNKLKINST